MAAINVLFTYNYGEEAFKSISSLGFVVDYCPEGKVHDFPNLDQVEVLVCYNPFQLLKLDQLPRLKYIFLSSAGVDQLPKAEVIARQVVVTNNKGGYSKPISEWIIWTLLSIYKNGSQFYGNKRIKQWLLSTDVYELTDKNIGILGTGSIGTECAKRLEGFEVNRIGYNTTGLNKEPFEITYKVDRLLETIGDLDALIITVPYTEKTHYLITKTYLDKMKPSSVLINVSRGAIVNEQDLLRKLEEGHFLGVGLDVFEEEPLPSSHPFWIHERVYITPHNSWVSEKRNVKRFQMLHENFKRLSLGETLVNIVNLEKGY